MSYGAMSALIRRGFQIVADEQTDCGGFPTLSSPDFDFKEPIVYLTNFAASNILSCLNSIQREVPLVVANINEFTSVRNRAADFLLANKSQIGSWNYWDQNSIERQKTPYPDDLDDTFAALSALHGYDEDLCDGKTLATIVKLLSAVELGPGGPYPTWIVGSDADDLWRDVDIIVNSNIAHFFSRFDVQLPRLEGFMDAAVSERRLASRYYPNICHTIYFLSRSYKGPEKQKLLEVIFSERNESGAWKNALESAMMLSAIMNLGFADSVAEADILALISTIEDENWKPHPFCIDPSREQARCFAGSRALTAAFVCETLAKYMRAKCCGISETRTSLLVKRGPQILNKIKNMAEEDLRRLPGVLHSEASACLKNIKDEEIVLLPYRMKLALGACGRKAPRALMARLALANLYGWAAYAIYDDILDGEADIRRISIGNFFLRQAVFQYAALSWFDFSLESLSRQLMNMVDTANIIETSRCRVSVEAGKIKIPKKIFERSVGHLGDKSIAHALPAIVVLSFAEESEGQMTSALLAFFRHYLSARQLHDDAHDWGADLSRGNLTNVGLRILKAWWAEHQDEESIDIVAEMPHLQREFWRVHLKEIVYEIRREIKKARRALERIPFISDFEPMASLIDRLGIAANKALREGEMASAFLQNI